MMPATAERRSLGQTLRAQGMVSEDQLRIALREQLKSYQPVGKLLVSLGFVSEAALREALAASLNKRSIDLSQATVDPAALRLVPLQLARRHQLLPLAYQASEHRLTIAIADVTDLLAIDQLRALTPDELLIETLIASETDIARGIDRHYGHELSIDGILHEIETGEADPDDLVTADEYSQPVVRLVDALLTDAVKRGASDIHFEPEANFLRIRYRIDGILRQIRALHKAYWAAMAVRVKVMSGMNIAETRAPQDGRFAVRVGGRPVDVRVASQPTLHGENLVLRILDRQAGILAIDQLGLDRMQQEMLLTMIARPEGILLVTGPTGSGKTTTLYSLLNHINRETINIMTLEDPVEYPMDMLRQTSVSDTGKLDFVNGIRSIMRQDPDVILVGEIRDADTADMAFRAAMTGHQVYSTLHCNSAPGALPRLRDIGILPDIMAGNIIGIVAQRLVRRLCPHCRQAYTPIGDEQRLFGLLQAAPTLYRPGGCAACDFLGYRGRFALMELLPMDEELDELVARRASLREIRIAAATRGYRPLAEDGLRRVLAGLTSLEEVQRVVDLSVVQYGPL